MRRAAALLIGLCISGCGGTLILENRTGGVPEPAPMPAPHARCPVGEIGKQEAVSIVMDAAARNRVTRTRIRKVERHKGYWKVELRGETRDGDDARIRAKVDRWSGEILAYKCEIDSDDDDRDDDHHRHH